MLTNLNLKSQSTLNYILITYGIIQVLVNCKGAEEHGQEKHGIIFLNKM